MRVVQVSNCLDKKLRMFGFEIPDILAIFLVLSFANLLFGQSAYSLFLVWVPTITSGLLLRYVKKGKPDKFLSHSIKYFLGVAFFSAFNPHDFEPLMFSNRRNK
mgnify:CR=1 FL=1